MKWKIANKIFAAQLGIVTTVLIHLDLFGFKNDIYKILRVHRRRRQWSSSDNFTKMLIVGEDRRFYEHGGFDLCGILRAIWVRINNDSIQGASTIEQQLVRVITGKYTMKLSRKIREIFLSTYLKNIMSKKQAAWLYLDVAYFGEGMNGLQAACEKLGINETEATLTEAAELVARLKYPEPSNKNILKINKINRRVKYICHQYSVLINNQIGGMSRRNSGDTIPII